MDAKRLAAVGLFSSVIEDGSADVHQDGDRIAHLGSGDFFGEIGLLETERRTPPPSPRRPT